MIYFPNIYYYGVQFPIASYMGFAQQQFLPTEALPIQNRPEIIDAQVQGVDQDESFEKLLEKELRKINNSKGRKVWTQEEDEKLIYLRERGKTWEQIVQAIQNGTEGNCIRRYQRLVREAQKWPKQVDQLIIYLCQQENLSWPEIRDCVMSKYQKNYMIKSIRERYVNCLKKGICKEAWKFEEDLRLLKLVKKHQRKWQQIANEFGERSERQLKNRYISTLEPIIKKINSRNCKCIGSEGQEPFHHSEL